MTTWRELEPRKVPANVLLLLTDEIGDVRTGRWVGYWAMEPGEPFEPIGWAHIPTWGERDVRAPRAPHSDEIDSTNEPELVICTVRDDFDGIGGDPSGWSLECRFSDGQKYGAVTIDRPFAKLAWKIMDFLNGTK